MLFASEDCSSLFNAHTHKCSGCFMGVYIYVYTHLGDNISAVPWSQFELLVYFHL